MRELLILSLLGTKPSVGRASIIQKTYPVKSTEELVNELTRLAVHIWRANYKTYQLFQNRFYILHPSITKTNKGKLSLIRHRVVENLKTHCMYNCLFFIK